jgi:hypothetical protein
LLYEGQGPQANVPVPHIVAAVPAAPHVTAHSLPPVQVVRQLPSHFTVHVAESLHVAVLDAPSCSLQFDIMLHVAIPIAPNLKSQSDVAVHVTRLPSPPTPLHIDVSLHVTVSASSDVPSHFAAFVQFNEQSSPPHVVLQSVPAVHVHAESVHTQPVPTQAGALLPPPPHPIETPKSNTRRVRMQRSYTRDSNVTF